MRESEASALFATATKQCTSMLAAACATCSNVPVSVFHEGTSKTPILPVRLARAADSRISLQIRTPIRP